MENLLFTNKAELPRVLRHLEVQGGCRATLCNLNDLINGETFSGDLDEAREYISYLIELQSLVELSINRIEGHVLGACVDGEEVKGYSLKKIKRSKVTKEAEFLDALASYGIEHEKAVQTKLLGVPALRNLVQGSPAEELLKEHLEVTEHISLKRI
tara:strand:+ start:564 stop:1031 length:468 start_codon:yes stop_codon:yes gene_type:complete